MLVASFVLLLLAGTDSNASQTHMPIPFADPRVERMASELLNPDSFSFDADVTLARHAQFLVRRLAEIPADSDAVAMVRRFDETILQFVRSNGDPVLGRCTWSDSAFQYKKLATGLYREHWKELLPQLCAALESKVTKDEVYKHPPGFCWLTLTDLIGKPFYEESRRAYNATGASDFELQWAEGYVRVLRQLNKPVKSYTILGVGGDMADVSFATPLHLSKRQLSLVKMLANLSRMFCVVMDEACDDAATDGAVRAALAKPENRQWLGAEVGTAADAIVAGQKEDKIFFDLQRLLVNRFQIVKRDEL